MGEHVLSPRRIWQTNLYQQQEKGPISLKHWILCEPVLIKKCHISCYRTSWCAQWNVREWVPLPEFNAIQRFTMFSFGFSSSGRPRGCFVFDVYTAGCRCAMASWKSRWDLPTTWLAAVFVSISKDVIALDHGYSTEDGYEIFTTSLLIALPKCSGDRKNVTSVFVG